MMATDQHAIGIGQIAAIEMVEILVSDRETGQPFNRRFTQTVLDDLPQAQQLEVLVALADIASAAVVAWRRRDVVGADLYLGTRRMLAGRMTGEGDDHQHEGDE